MDLDLLLNFSGKFLPQDTVLYPAQGCQAPASPWRSQHSSPVVGVNIQ